MPPYMLDTTDTTGTTYKCQQSSRFVDTTSIDTRFVLRFRLLVTMFYNLPGMRQYPVGGTRFVLRFRLLVTMFYNLPVPGMRQYPVGGHVCVLHIQPFFPLVDIQHTQCPRWLSQVTIKTNLSSAKRFVFMVTCNEI